MNEQILERGWFNLVLNDGSTVRIPYKVFVKGQSVFISLENSEDKRIDLIGSQLSQTQWSCQSIVDLVEYIKDCRKIGSPEFPDVFRQIFLNGHKIASISQQEILSVAKRYCDVKES